MMQVRVPRLVLPAGLSRASCMLSAEHAWLLSSRLPAKEVGVWHLYTYVLIMCKTSYHFHPHLLYETRVNRYVQLQLVCHAV